MDFYYLRSVETIIITFLLFNLKFKVHVTMQPRGMLRLCWGFKKNTATCPNINGVICRFAIKNSKYLFQKSNKDFIEFKVVYLFNSFRIVEDVFIKVKIFAYISQNLHFLT